MLPNATLHVAMSNIIAELRVVGLFSETISVPVVHCLVWYHHFVKMSRSNGIRSSISILGNKLYRSKIVFIAIFSHLAKRNLIFFCLALIPMAFARDCKLPVLKNKYPNEYKYISMKRFNRKWKKSMKNIKINPNKMILPKIDNSSQKHNPTKKDNTTQKIISTMIDNLAQKR